MDGVIEQKPTDSVSDISVKVQPDRREAKSLALRKAILKETAYLKQRDRALWMAGARFVIRFLGSSYATHE